MGKSSMHQLKCGEIRGGFQNCNEDLLSAGLEISMVSRASNGSQGGDIYYLSLCQHSLLTRMIIADVVGHGEAVAEMSRYIYQAIKSHLNDTSGQKMLSELNRKVFRQGLDAMTTLVMAAFYQFDRNLYFANAGHPPALFKPANDSRWYELKMYASGNDPALAVQEESIYRQKALRLNSNDRLILYTDGLIEVYHAKKGLLGLEGLKALLNRHKCNSVSELKDIVMDEIQEFAEGPLDHDDLTLMVTQIL
jgi:serine phosphatase RsbU (regulator of sigma subunit)